MQYVEAALNGDDNTFTCGDEIVGWFNAEHIAQVWGEELGIVTNSSSGEWKPRKVSEVDFLSHHFCWVTYGGSTRILPVPEREKVLASLEWGSEINDVRFSLLRLYALRLESWADEATRKDIMACITYLEKTYKFSLCGVVEVKGTLLAWKDIQAVYKTDRQIWELYTSPDAVEPIFWESLHSDDFLSSWLSFKMRDPAKKKEESEDQTQSFCIRLPMGKKSKQRKAKAAKAAGKGASGGPTKAQREAQSRRDKARAKQHSNAGKPSKKGSMQMGGYDANVRSFAAPTSFGHEGHVRMTHKPNEITKSVYLGELKSSSDGSFAVWRRIPLNPGVPPGVAVTQPDINDGLDTWTSNVARNWIWHRPKYVRVHLKTKIGTQTPGDMGVTTVHESKKPPVASIQQAMNYDGTTYGSVWKPSLVHNCLTRNASREWKYIRTGTPAGVVVSPSIDNKESFDLDEFDVGFINIWSSGAGAASIALADVSVEYCWELKEPNSSALISSPGPSPPSTGYAADVWEFVSAVASTTTGVQFPAPFLIADNAAVNAGWLKDPDSTLGASMVYVSNEQVRIRPNKAGYFLAVVTAIARTVGTLSPVEWGWANGQISKTATTASYPVLLSLADDSEPYDIFFDSSTGVTNLISGSGHSAFSAVSGSQVFDTVTSAIAFETTSATDSVFLSSNARVTETIVADNTGNAYVGYTVVLMELPPALNPLALARSKKKETKEKVNREMQAQIDDLVSIVKKMQLEQRPRAVSTESLVDVKRGDIPPAAKVVGGASAAVDRSTKVPLGSGGIMSYFSSSVGEALAPGKASKGGEPVVQGKAVPAEGKSNTKK
jgi:hypothetical protein